MTTLGLAALLAGLLTVAAANTRARSIGAGVDATHRPFEPAVIKGEALSAMQGAPIDELVLYAYRAGHWSPIPFQIDEVTASGVYSATEDGLLDENDELVFLGGDASGAAPTSIWVDDDAARLGPRQVITLTDPLQPSWTAYAYLYRSKTLPATTTRYVQVNAVAGAIQGVSYTLGFAPEQFVGLADLTINGNPADILDRQKIRVRVNSPFPLPDVTLDEEMIVDFLGTSATFTPTIAGPVRAIGGGRLGSYAYYGDRLQVQAALALAELELPISGATIDSVRVSLDLNDPNTSGLAPATYYDSNTPAGVPIDGQADDVPATPPFDWYQASGSFGGLGAVLVVDPGVDLLSNYYKDDAEEDAAGDDTGDKRSFADTGILIEKSGSTLGDISFTQLLYVLPPTSGSVGATLIDWFNKPLVTSVAPQTLASPPERTYLPLVIR
jgi:hypothetical protein